MAANSLERFVEAQADTYQTALAEIKSGRKRSHWIWYIFPQLKELGYSSKSEYYGIKDVEEAKDYLKHPLLGKRLIEITNVLLSLPSTNAGDVMGYPDDLKLKSSMTLFARVPGTDLVFRAVLDKFFDGQEDKQTLDRLLH